MPRNSKSNTRDKSKTKRTTAKSRKSRVKRTKKPDVVNNNTVVMNNIEVQQMIRDNSLLISPLAQNNWFEQCFAFEAERMQSAIMLHRHLFDVSVMKGLKDDHLVSLYGTLIKDVQVQKSTNMKIVEMKENSRIISGISKLYAEQEKRRAIESNSETHHVDTLVQQLLDESLRHAMNDQIGQFYGGSNSYRPPENTNYEILAKDANAED